MSIQLDLFLDSRSVMIANEAVSAIVARNAEVYRQIYRRGPGTLAKASDTPSDTAPVSALPAGVRP